MYFRHHFIPEPYTIYNNVYKLEHGYYSDLIENDYCLLWIIVTLYSHMIKI